MKIFDSHLHIIEPGYPLIPNGGYLPNYYTSCDYKAETSSFDVAGGAIVSGSFQGTDQTYLTHALEQLGENFVGVTQLPEDITDEEIQILHQQGVRAVRFNLHRGGKEVMKRLVSTADRVFTLVGWHVELYMDVADLPEIRSILLQLPAFSIDHLGLSRRGLSELMDLVEEGVKVKATGFGRVDFDIIPVMKEIHRRNPEALLFGTDLPSTRAKRRFRRSDITMITEHFSRREADKILYQNAREWYSKR
ncbi:amidohydrolase family protein [Salimicrobium flavidum]|uniref:Predicted metal-dependent hydrolase, TIM-barrel fold n=1 Tax=Salimicrobium flavidum TaxID=570947 RepID=A0A1N7IRI3_9BACI|nr:amidohydrolase family protein [Salimicrobium flavidum]SIS39692.1 Predicted metal-dependent hydrolase, TIM-barrel fold [Salimicrobium flavidum]